jgi:CheY-like chemotaxis protein
LLLVDGDTRSLRVLEVSLRKAGFMVTAALSVQDALDKLELNAPDLIISETTFPTGDGFELRRRVRATPEWSEIPFIFLTAEAAIENKIRGLELGVDDYLTKPIYIKEIVTRINILLQKRQRVRFEERRDGRTRFAGRVQDMPVVDVIQTIEISRKSGVIQFVGERGRQAAIYFRDGRVIDAEAGALQGEDAVYRLLTWSEGEFEVVFRTVRRREVITVSSQGLLMEGMRRLDEWSRLFEQLPPLTHRFEVDTIELAARLGDVPDDNNRILRLFDGKRTLLEVIDASDVGDLECLQAISRLYFEELLLDLDHGKTPRRDTGKSLPLVEIETPAPLEEVASGPVGSGPVGSEPVGSGPVGSGPVGSGPVGSEPVGSEPAGSEPVGSEPATPAVSIEVAHAESAESAESVESVENRGDGSERDHDDVGPLMGGYRPSSLRLIDEAVAAAQAIEPALFDDSLDTPLRPPPETREPPETQGTHRGNGVAVPATSAPAHDDDATPPGLAAVPAAAPAMQVTATTLLAAEREESGLRMIGSLGRDRAEASGELAPLGQRRPLRSETARELVTILPRRITRELPVITQELAESLPTPTPTSPVLAPRPVVALAVESPAPALPQPRVSLPGSGVRAASRSRRLLRIARAVDGSGPGLGALLLILLAAVLAGTAVLLRLRRHGNPPQHSEVVQDAAVASAPAAPIGTWSAAPDAVAEPEDASRPTSYAGPARRDGGVRTPDVGTYAPDARMVDGGSHLVDGGARVVGGGVRGVDAGVRAPDARASNTAAAATVRADSTDKAAEAKALYDKAHDAMDEGDFARALQLAEASLRMRRTARTYLLHAQAEQRLDRVDDALASVDAAAQLAPESGTVWEIRGRILWAARRRDEARAAFEKFLRLEPDSPKAASVRRLMNEPR